VGVLGAGGGIACLAIALLRRRVAAG